MFLDENCTCFVRDGKTYCKKDYVRLFGAKCDKCGHTFGKSDYVMRARNRIFHLDCFKCIACERQLIPGDSYALKEDGLYCNEHHKACDNDGGIAGEGENNNNKSILNNNSNNSEDGDDKSEEGKTANILISLFKRGGQLEPKSLGKIPPSWFVSKQSALFLSLSICAILEPGRAAPDVKRENTESNAWTGQQNSTVHSQFTKENHNALQKKCSLRH